MAADDERSNREFLRHTLATLAYRGGKTVRDAPNGFSAFAAASGSRTAGQILAHVGDLLDWAISLAQGQQAWNNTPPADWQADATRFFDRLTRLDDYLASNAPLGCSARELFQGPVADALTHVGQIAMLRRLAGGPIRGESYLQADIVAGRVGPKQSLPRREFD